MTAILYDKVEPVFSGRKNNGRAKRRRSVTLPNSESNTEVDYRAAIEAAAESILVTSRDLDYPGPSIVYVNKAFEKMTGWSRNEILGKSPRILQGPKTELSVFDDLRERIRSQGIWEGKTINYRKDGSEFWMEWSVVPLAKNGEICQYLAIQRDITKRIAAEHQLHQTQLAERAAERARTNLARYFSPKLLNTIVNKDQPLGAVRRQNLAVIFADVVGFTRLSEQLEPENVIGLLREIHSWVGDVVFSWEGSIEGFIGDETLAIFGFPVAGKRDANNALACAYALLNKNRDWNQERVEQGLEPIHIRIGMNYGPVVLGDVGTAEFLEFTVIGDTVNIASRLQQATRSLDCDLVVGENLVNAVKTAKCDNSEKLLEPLHAYGNYQVRGRSRKVVVYTLDTPRDTSL